MVPSLTNYLVLLAWIVLAVACGIGYFHRFRVERPPIGVFGLRDILFVLAMVVVMPPLYLALPNWLVGTVFAVFGTALVYMVSTPVLGRAGAAVAAVALGGADVALVLGGYAGTIPFALVNDVVLVVLAVGACNIWVQSGLRARHVAVFAGVLTAYDVVATAILPMTGDFFLKVHALPFTPVLAWGTWPTMAASGLGDLLVAVLWPLVVAKAYTARAAVAAAAATVGSFVVIFTLILTHVLHGTIPAIALIGPVVLLHYLWLLRRHPREHPMAVHLAREAPAAIR